MHRPTVVTGAGLSILLDRVRLAIRAVTKSAGSRCLHHCSGTTTWFWVGSIVRSVEEFRQRRKQSRSVKRLALPHYQHLPTELSQRCDVSSITLHVLFELFAPIVSARLRGRRSDSALVPMPETSMDKDRLPQAWKRQVRRAWQVWAMNAKPIAQRVRRTARSGMVSFPRTRRISADRAASTGVPTRCRSRFISRVCLHDNCVHPCVRRPFDFPPGLNQ